MKSILKPVLAAGLVLAAASPMAAIPASAQVVKGIGVISAPDIVVASAAYKKAEEQRPVTYKQYYDQAKALNDQIEAQIKPLADKFEADRKAPNAKEEDLQKQFAAIQQIDKQGEAQLRQVLQPVAQSQAYVKEQIEDVLAKAIDQAAAKKNITLILTSDVGVLLRDASYNLNADVIKELDTLLPMAQISPPPGWMPREVRERLAAQAAAQAASGGAAPAPAAPAQSTAPAGPPAESR